MGQGSRPEKEHNRRAYQCGVGLPVGRTSGYRKGGFNLADFGKELLTGFVAGGLSSAAFYGAGKAVEAVKGSVRGVWKHDTRVKHIYRAVSPETNRQGLFNQFHKKFTIRAKK